MAERRMGIIAFLFCLCLCLMPCCAQAASMLDAREAISPEKDCSLSLSYCCDGTAFADVPVKLYKFADVSAEGRYSLTESFASSKIVLNGIQSAGEWNVIRSTLEGYILANKTKEILSATTDSSGSVSFAALKPGLYLTETVKTENYSFGSALIMLPGLGADGLWQYQLAVSPKYEKNSPPEGDEETEYKVLKLWKGDDGKTNRPTSVKVEIFRDGESKETVILSEENQWSYKWSSKKDGAAWKVVEKNVPSGYTATVEERDGAFIVTNTWRTDDSDSDGYGSSGNGSSPKTGDTSNIMLYTVMMYISGILLVLLGFAGKRTRK